MEKNLLIEILLKRFTTLDLIGLNQKADIITSEAKEKTHPDPKKLESFVRNIPGFTISDMINFGSYCSEVHKGEIVTEEEMEETLSEWLQKIK